MKVLLLTSALAEVGDEEGRIREISKLGVQLSVVVPAGRWRGSSNAAEKLKPHGYELTIRGCLFSRIDSVRIRCHIYYYGGISRVIGGAKWDLVHIEDEAYNLATYQIVRECQRYERCVIFTARKNILRSFPFPFNFFERYVYQRVAGAIACNLEASDVLSHKGFGKPLVCIQGGATGVDRTLFRRLEARDLRRDMGLIGAFVIGFVGQVAYRKGLGTLLQALALLPKECVLVLVGAGPDESTFRSLERELGLSARVRWESWADHRETVKYMNAFDVLVLPSRTLKTWKEDFGRVLIEAMACETCVVGSDSGEIPNVIGDAGLIFREGDAQGLAGCLRLLMEDSSLRQTLGRRGRERVLKRFTYEKVARDTVDFYKQVCAASG